MDRATPRTGRAEATLAVAPIPGRMPTTVPRVTPTDRPHEVARRDRDTKTARDLSERVQRRLRSRPSESGIPAERLPASSTAPINTASATAWTRRAPATKRAEPSTRSIAVGARPMRSITRCRREQQAEHRGDPRVRADPAATQACDAACRTPRARCRTRRARRRRSLAPARDRGRCGRSTADGASRR